MVTGRIGVNFMTDISSRPVSPVNGQPLPRGKPFEQGEQQREIARKAGKKSAQVKKARKTLREELFALLDERLTDKKTGKKVSTRQAISAAMVKQALGGNTKAYEIIRDTIGEKPVEKVEQKIDVDYRQSVEYVKNLMKGTEE